VNLHFNPIRKIN
jgi:phage-related tail protein